MFLLCSIDLPFKVKAVKGLSWGQAAIGNATWSGARLCDVLRDMGIEDGKTDALHVQVGSSSVLTCIIMVINLLILTKEYTVNTNLHKWLIRPC